MSDPINALLKISCQVIVGTEPDRILAETNSTSQDLASLAVEIKRVANAARDVQLRDRLAVPALAVLLNELESLCSARLGAVQNYRARAQVGPVMPWEIALWRQMYSEVVPNFYEMHNRIRNLWLANQPVRGRPIGVARENTALTTEVPAIGAVAGGRTAEKRRKGDKLALACELKRQPEHWEDDRAKIAELVHCDVSLLANDRYRAVEAKYKAKARAARARKGSI
jgi:hypothetical protein